MDQSNAAEKSWSDPKPSSSWPNYILGNSHGVNLNEELSL